MKKKKRHIFLKFILLLILAGIAMNVTTGRSVYELIAMVQGKEIGDYNRKRFLQAVEEREEKVKIYASDWEEETYGPWEEANGVIFDWISKNPDYYFIDNSKTYITSIGIGDKVNCREVSFVYFEELKGQDVKDQIDQAAQEILDQIPADASDWDKAKVIHDELVKRVHYEEGKYDQNMYGALIEGKCVCSGYANAYAYLLEQVGISNRIVSGYTDLVNAELAQDDVMSAAAQSHAWNLVTLVDEEGNSHDSFIDVTWDDPDRLDEDGKQYVTYDWFGVSLEALEKAHRSGFLDSYHLEDYHFDDYSNYHKHTGSLIESFDLEEVAEIMNGQKESGMKLLTVRFTDKGEFFNTQAEFKKNDLASQLISELGLSRASYAFSPTEKYGEGIMCLDVFVP